VDSNLAFRQRLSNAGISSANGLRNMSNATPLLSPEDRFSLPEVLEYLEAYRCRREGLYEYLRQGQLRAVCYPYRLEPDREVPIEPAEWPEWFREPWEFPVYAGYIGDINEDDDDARVPLHIVPRAARADCDKKLLDGGPAATSATVYVLGNELVRFITWLQIPGKSRPSPRRKGAGRPTKHDYTEIEACLESLFKAKGRVAFDKPAGVIAHLERELGKDALYAESTLRNHIKKWLSER